MTFKRILIIILALLLLAGILFGISWYVARRNAEKGGTDPMSFREFLGIGTSNAPGQNGSGELTSDFTGQPLYTIKYDENNNGINDWVEDLNNNGLMDGDEDFNNNGIADGQEDSDNDGTANNKDTYVEPDIDDTDLTPIDPDNTNTNPDPMPTDPGPFTEGPITPEGDNLGGGGNPSGGGNPGGGAGSGGTNPGDEDNTPGDGGFGEEEDVPDEEPGITTTQLSCSPEDTNIVFTASELAELKILQDRFNQLAPTLYDVGAVQEQVDFYNALKSRSGQTAEYLNFCQQNSANVPSTMTRRVPTPFYHDGAKDSNTFTDHELWARSAYSGAGESKYDGKIERYPELLISVLERLLRINIW